MVSAEPGTTCRRMWNRNTSSGSRRTARETRARSRSERGASASAAPECHTAYRRSLRQLEPPCGRLVGEEHVLVFLQRRAAPRRCARSGRSRDGWPSSSRRHRPSMHSSAGSARRRTHSRRPHRPPRRRRRGGSAWVATRNSGASPAPAREDVLRHAPVEHRRQERRPKSVEVASPSELLRAHARIRALAQGVIAARELAHPACCVREISPAVEPDPTLTQSCVEPILPTHPCAEGRPSRRSPAGRTRRSCS